MKLECALCTDLIEDLKFAIPIRTTSSSDMVICLNCLKEELK